MVEEKRHQSYIFWKDFLPSYKAKVLQARVV